MSPVNGWNKKHSSKKAVPRIYTLEKRVFAVSTFKGLRVVFFFGQSEKGCGILWSV